MQVWHCLSAVSLASTNYLMADLEADRARPADPNPRADTLYPRDLTPPGGALDKL